MAAPNAETAMVENFPHLDSRLREVDLHGNLLPCVDVRVVSLLQCVFYEQQARCNSLQRRDKRMLNLKQNAITPARNWRENTWKALSSSLSWADVNVVRILLCFLFSVRTPSCPGYILYGNPAEKSKSIANFQMKNQNSFSQKEETPASIPLPLVPEMVRIIERGGAEEAMRPVCADCEISRFLARSSFS